MPSVARILETDSAAEFAALYLPELDLVFRQPRLPWITRLTCALMIHLLRCIWLCAAIQTLLVVLTHPGQQVDMFWPLKVLPALRFSLGAAVVRKLFQGAALSRVRFIKRSSVR